MSSKNKFKLGAFIVFIVALVLVKQYTAVGDYMTVEQLRLWIEMPLLMVINPTIASPGTGLQQRANWVSRLPTP